MAGRFNKAMKNLFDVQDQPKKVQVENVIQAVEEQYENPLDVKIGSRIRINRHDLVEHMFEVRAIREMTEKLLGGTLRIVDYDLFARVVGENPDIRMRLRLIPSDEPDPASNNTHCMIAINLEDEMSYDEEFHGIVTDEDGIFTETDNKTGEECSFERFSSDSPEPHEVSIVIIKDENFDGTVKPDEVSHENIEYWDYARNYDINDEISDTEFLFVELNIDNGIFQIWKGTEVESNAITVF